MVKFRKLTLGVLVTSVICYGMQLLAIDVEAPGGQTFNPTMNIVVSGDDAASNSVTVKIKKGSATEKTDTVNLVDYTVDDDWSILMTPPSGGWTPDYY